MRRLTEEEAGLLAEPNFATVATLAPDGSAQASVVWIDYDGEYVLFNTAVGRAKERNLRRDPRVTVVVPDRGDPYRYVAVKGTAELSEEGGQEHIERLAHKYTGRPFGVRPGERRVIVRVRPGVVDAYGFGDPAKTSRVAETPKEEM